MQTTVNKTISYLVVTTLVCISGNQAFNFHGHPRTVLVIVAVLFSILMYRYKLFDFSQRFFWAFGGFSAILLLQSLFFSFFPAVTIAGFLIRLFIAYAACRLVKDFSRTYINIMFWTAIISLCFFLSEEVLYAFDIEMRKFFEPLAHFIGPKKELYVLVYNFDVRARNAGMFWEPGAFAGYLMLAIIFLGLEKEKFETNWLQMRFIILFVVLLTTFSTTGYVVLPFALLLYVRLNTKARARVLTTFLLFYICALAAGFFAYHCIHGRNLEAKGAINSGDSTLYLSNVHRDFIIKKIRSQWNNAIKNGPGRYRNRFDDLVCDLDYIQQRPLLGWGLNRKTRYILHSGVSYGSGHGEGLSDFVVKFGFIGLSIFLICVLDSFMQLSQNNLVLSTFATFLILLILNGECFLNFPLFLGLMFLGEGQRQLKTCQ